jgi:signal transduction histidine kinase
MPFERHYLAWIGASVITVVSFVGATAYTQNRLARLDAVSSTIETNAVPSIEYLSRVAVRLTRLNQLMDDVAASDSRRAATLSASRKEAAALVEDVDHHLQLPTLPGEQQYWTELRANVNRAVRLVAATVDDGGPTRSPTTPPPAQVDDVLDSAVRSVLTTLNYDVRQSEVLARDVRAVRATTLRTIVGLDALSALVALGAVGFAFQATRRHDQLLAEHNALLTARVTELDRFAGRVAHDVLSPLGTIAAGLSLLGRACDEHARSSVDRSQRALRRVHQLVHDLLTFARSGARPDSMFNCALDAVVAGTVADSVDGAAEKGIELLLDAGQPAHVACAEGVITSITQNLVKNAINYMGVRPVRRISVRVSSSGDVARLEVEDTGPGIPPEIHATLFEPFIRGPREQVNGTGLGLATVKRLVQSHGGRVGVESEPRSGTLFWVNLPLLSKETPRASSSAEPHHV